MASPQLPAKYTQLPGLMIGQIETLMWGIGPLHSDFCVALIR